MKKQWLNGHITNFKYYGDANGSPQGHSYPEFCYMRSAEMLLIMAEAEANLNNVGAALSHLNTLQNAREVAKPTTVTLVKMNFWKLFM